jgi:hypothetical protein
MQTSDQFVPVIELPIELPTDIDQELLVAKLEPSRYLYLPHCGSRSARQGVPLNQSFPLN